MARAFIPLRKFFRDQLMRLLPNALRFPGTLSRLYLKPKDVMSNAVPNFPIYA